jgi:hypothetical protein
MCKESLVDNRYRYLFADVSGQWHPFESKIQKEKNHAYTFTVARFFQSFSAHSPIKIGKFKKKIGHI